jgi:chromosome segregation ATPase
MQILDELLAQGKITPAEVESFKAGYQRLHEIVVQTFQSERQLLLMAKGLKAGLEAEKVKLDNKKYSSQDIESDIQALEREEKDISSELQKFVELSGALDYELGEMEANRRDKQTELEEKQAASLAHMEPVLKDLTAKIQELKMSIEQNQDALRKENDSVQDYINKVETCTKDIANNDKEKLKRRELYNSVSMEPERLQSAIALIEASQRDLEQEANAYLEEIRRLEDQLSEVQHSRKITSDNIAVQSTKVDKISSKARATAQEVDDLKRERDLEISKKEEANERIKLLEEETQGLTELLRRHLSTSAQ